MKNNITLDITTKVTILIWTLIQLILIMIFWDHQQGSDQGEYIRIARECFEAKEWYPSSKDIYSNYIWAPGFINYLILQLKLFGTLKLNIFFNLLMNIGIIILIFHIGKRFFTEKTASIAVILWCFLYSNLMIVLPAGTEIPFLFLALAGFSLCLHPKFTTLFIAGVLFTLANWIRPLVIIFIFCILIYMFFNKYKWFHYVALFSGLILSVIIIGTTSKNNMGHFVYQSTTSGFNLIMTSNDKAYGGVATSLMNDTTSSVYIKDKSIYTFAQRDSIWKARSVEWIKQNPIRFCVLYIKKIGGLYIEDSWSDRPILGGAGFVDSAVSGKVSKQDIIMRMLKMGLKSLVYYFILIACFYSFIIHRKELLSMKSVLLLLLIAGTAGTCLFAVSPRYHYPFLFVIVLFAAYGIEQWINKRTLINPKK